MKSQTAQRAAQLAGLFTGLLGLAGCLGWILDVPLMRSFVPGRSEIKFNTALAITLGGTALLLLATHRQGPWKKLGQAFAAILAAIGASTLVQYLFSVSLGIDQIFFKDAPDAIATTSPGRMSPQTTITFLCIGAALLLLDKESKRGHRPAQWLALAAAMFPLQLLIQHLYGGHMVLAFGPAQYSLMAIPTVLALLSLSAGTVLARPKAGWMTFVTSRSFAGRSLRRMLVLGIALPSIIGASILYLFDGQNNPPGFAISAFAMFTTLSFCAFMTRHARHLHTAERERARAEGEREKALADLQNANQLLNDRARQLEILVQQRTAALTEVNQQLETFAFSVAHDLRAPVRAQNGFARVLEQEFAGQLGPEGRRMAQRIRESAEKLYRMLEELLNYARLGRGEWRIESVALGPILEAVREEFTAEFRARDGILVVEPTAEVVEAHGATLSLCVANVLSNAAKFTRPDVPPEARVWCEGNDGVVHLFVRDKGIGIATELQEKIFGVFQRLHAPSEYPGTGIGLALVRRGVERMGGKVTVESKPGEGSTFCIELKCVRPREQPPDTQAPSRLVHLGHGPNHDTCTS